jgi:hypothetical protein
MLHTDEVQAVMLNEISQAQNNRYYTILLRVFAVVRYVVRKLSDAFRDYRELGRKSHWPAHMECS